MTISRRGFAKTGLGAGALAILGENLFAQEELRENIIPSSGERIPVIGLGTNRYGVSNNPSAKAPLQHALKKFHELGGTVIDTAPGYRNSEEILGHLISDLGIRNDLFIATKVDRNNRAASTQGMQNSYRDLQVKKTDLMQVHNFKGWKDSIPLIHEWKQQGRIRYIGITTSSERQYELMEQVMKDYDLDFIQINYSVANQRVSSDRILPLAADRGMAVLINRPFGGGRVFKKLANLAVPMWVEDFDCSSWGQFMLKYVLSHPAVTATIPGMTKVHHVIDNMMAGKGRLPTESERRRQEAFFDSL
ncbi:uncharacterized protein METZ01_LOCUS82083 [marine metagenome]|uniref:NADP-dependent oxidoreductase domain-containing protein n=1 Tax=marine metagenome TaxID=408172 RepID=A0A381UM71_9ZZZZ